jgi:hypothetical protein
MGSFEGKLSSLETKLTKKINSLDKRTNKKLDVIISYFEHQDIDVRKRLNRIELHLGLTPLNS